MPRTARLRSRTGIYHIMVRGINRQDIFRDDEDRKRYLDTLKRITVESISDVIDQGNRPLDCLIGDKTYSYCPWSGMSTDGSSYPASEDLYLCAEFLL